ELPKFHKTIDELLTMLDKWVYFFKYAEDTSEKEVFRLGINDPIIERAYEELNRFSWSDIELLTYDQKDKYARTYKASMDQKFDEGEAAGMAKGMAAGVATVAKAMKSQGMTWQSIHAVTALSQADIESL
ncbi:MAG: PD-(D/E)XK nuclease family transposase, partial [Chlamydiales bacterium]|nr:PD-(D/E)XK nuclease family transposase [Chlamydiales bacterium]